jgi:hypothetical protein
MIGVIPNPTKSITIDFPISKIKEAVEGIPSRFQSTLTEKDETLNMYKFDVGEFLSFGSYININLSEISENKTQIIVEICRKIGAFDQSFEISAANRHIENTLKAISKNVTDGTAEIVTKTVLNFLGKTSVFVAVFTITMLSGANISLFPSPVVLLALIIGGWVLSVRLLKKVDFLCKQVRVYA